MSLEFETISQLNQTQFVEQFKDIYEHSPWVAERTYLSGAAPFKDIDALHCAMSDVLIQASKEEQLALINAHPDLAGKAAIKGELTQASTNEQAGAGIHDCTPEEFAKFTQLNNAYKARFGFPFIKAVKGSNRHEILAAFETRIHHSLDEEFQTALNEINKIARFRLEAMMQPEI
jgi:2-oxo-4-hydroxy-4-carboxy-5-ureidoimidazoline decarboxylase